MGYNGGVCGYGNAGSLLAVVWVGNGEWGYGGGVVWGYA